MSKIDDGWSVIPDATDGACSVLSCELTALPRLSSWVYARTTGKRTGEWKEKKEIKGE